MTSARAAIAWEFRRRHRFGLLAIAAYFVTLGVIRLLLLEPGMPVTFDSPESFALVVVVPMSATFLYLLSMFTFGVDGDIAARESMYPARMFALPVTTTALTFWPMLYGAAASALFWFATRLLAVFPSGLPVPVFWPAVLAVVLLAWTQALMWMPYALTGTRVGVAVLWLSLIDGVVLTALYANARESVMIAILAPLLPLAYLVARVAVARARAGVLPEWRGGFQVVRGRAYAERRRRNFATPARAQLWFEWLTHGRALPVLVAMVLPLELAILFLVREAPIIVRYTVLGMLLTPPLLAMVANAHSREYGMPAFLATRPLSSAVLVAAKLRAALLSTLVAWLLVLIAVPLALWLSGTTQLFTEPGRRIIAFVGTARGIVFILLVLVLLMATTWKQLVQRLYIGLTGREWLIKGSTFLTLALLFMIGPVLSWLHDPSVLASLWDNAAWIPAGLVLLKMGAAFWVVTVLYRAQLVSDRALIIGAVSWCLAVLALHTLLVWLIATPFLPRYQLLLVAILLVPLVRVSAAPLALAWNRHR
jgi:hypothetical protein